MKKLVLIKRSVIESILRYAEASHPREAILLLTGKVKRDRILIEDVEVPPLATYGHGFSSFPSHMLPIDFSIVGTAHSHPSGIPHPSIRDLNSCYGALMLITSFPYDSDQCVALFDKEGRPANYKIDDLENHE